MAREPYQTNCRLWVCVSTLAFVALGFVNPLAGITKCDDLSLWSHVDAALHRSNSNGFDESAWPFLGFHAGFMAMPAVIVGWAIQALIVILWSSIRSRPLSPDPSVFDGLASPLSKEELERRKNSKERTYSTAEVLAHLEKL